MKALRKNYLLLVLSVVLTLCLSLAFLFTSQTAKADEVNADLFTMEQGAQAALTKDGLRFRVKMGENVYAKIVTDDTANEKTLSVLVAPKTLFDKVTDGNYVNLEKKVEIVFEDESKIYLQDGYYWANAVLTNLDAENNMEITDSQYDLSFSAIGVINTVGGQPEYATFHDGDVANNTRTQYDVLKAAVLAVEDEEGVYDNAGAILDQENSPYKNWFGTEQYPIDVDNADGYGALQAKVAAGLTTTAHFNVYNKFDIVDRENLPENTDFYHYVKFFDDSTELETVEVKEGNEAVCSKTVPAYKALEAMNSGYVRGYKNGGWVANDGSALDISAVYANVEAKVKWVWDDHSAVLREDALREEPNTVFNWDREIGVTQVYNPGDNAFERSFDTTVKLAGQNGTTKLAFPNSENVSSLYFGYSLLTMDYDTSKYVVFDVYVDFDDSIFSVWLRLGYYPGAMLQNKAWSTVILPVSEFKETGWFMCDLRNSDNGTVAGASGSLYLSEGKLMDADEITVLSTGYTTHVNEVTLGDVTLVAAENTGNEWFYTWYGTPNDGIFKQSFDQGLSLIQGKLFYNYYVGSRESNNPQMTFKTAQTGTIYFTARGLVAGESDLLLWDESGTLDTDNYAPSFKYVGDAENGYKVYSVDLGSKSIKTIRLRRDQSGACQVWISDISTTNPLA